MKHQLSHVAYKVPGMCNWGIEDRVAECPSGTPLSPWHLKAVWRDVQNKRLGVRGLSPYSTFTSCCCKTVIQPLWISVFSSFRWKQESQICGVLSNGYNKNDNIIFVGVATIAMVVRLLINFDRGIKGPRQSPEWSPELLWPALLALEAVGSPRGLGLPWAICDLGDMCLLLAARPRP